MIKVATGGTAPRALRGPAAADPRHPNRAQTGPRGRADPWVRVGWTGEASIKGPTDPRYLLFSRAIIILNNNGGSEKAGGSEVGFGLRPWVSVEENNLTYKKSEKGLKNGQMRILKQASTIFWFSSSEFLPWAYLSYAVGTLFEPRVKVLRINEPKGGMRERGTLPKEGRVHLKISRIR